MLDAEILVCAGSRDLPWLNCSLRSIKRFWEGAYAPIIVVPPECRNELPSVVHELKCTVVLKPVTQHAYVRMTIDCYLSAPMVLCMDVRGMFTRPCSIATFTDSTRKPILAVESYAEAVARPGADPSCVVNRKDTADDLLDVDSVYDYTAREPLVFYRHSVRRTREIIEERSKRPMAVIMRNYCPEYWSFGNVVGTHIWSKERNSYQLVPAKECPAAPIRIFSGCMDPTKGEDLREVQRILA
jgi:hypothetical protein